LVIEREQLCALIPHAGDMCLLDRVEHWGQTSISCSSNSHLLAYNPLLNNNKLAAVHAVEYAAQSMAVHGGLLAREQGISVAQGFIAALRDIRLHVENLHDKPEPLQIHAEVMLRNTDAMIYSFEITSGALAIAEGRITVMGKTQ
jgi:predicted hotdog family 3-hydroxylacyl-ACP dehydratase